ncbi:MAG: hypothetical protein GC185_13425 [Alphaproteobacteria bacterium]|nr:hypothetical protein [Alphaproteobacteria bacterium]
MAKLWHHTNNEDNERQLERVDLKTLAITRPSLIFLTGFFTYDKTPGYIDDALTTMQETMAARPGEKKPLDIYAWSHAGLKEVFNLVAYHTRPGSHASRAGYALAAGVLMPLVADNFSIGPDGKAQGTPLPLEEAKKRLRNVTFFSYSAGTVTAQEGFNAALRMMKHIGYKEKDAREALREVVLISTGVISRPGREKERFTTLYLEATNDKIVAAKNRLWRPLREIFSRVARRLKIRHLSPSSTVLTAAVSRRRYEMREQADGKIVKTEVKSLLPRWFPVKTNHELPRYITQDEGLSEFAKIALYSLTNAVNRTQSVTPKTLLQPPAALQDGPAQAFRDKIAKATLPPKKRKWWKKLFFSG